ncbi:unnamed protein product [Prorocentrum cordatum]|uniref:NAD-dependent epimerase/dehydratase domain-containing protein n=1 Tax=Prorocentrum cordatum TaxID=2364126 RepID=A0ABN9RPK8_9DINO|nr:unnamed protein product [Polarella glacialis]
MVRPNIASTEAVLLACAGSTSVPALVLTSSMAAVRAPGQPFRPGRSCYDHHDWNSLSVAEDGWGAAYQFSKAQSERMAWERAGELGVPLIALCPCAIIGPERRLPGTAPGRFPWMSAAAIHSDGPEGGMLLADVRDVASAHAAAGELLASGGAAAGERVVVSAEEGVSVSCLAEAWGRLEAGGDEGAAGVARLPRGAREVECADRLESLLGVGCRALEETLRDMASDHRAAWRAPAAAAGGGVLGGLLELFR